jgi:hypothetical protein
LNRLPTPGPVRVFPRLARGRHYIEAAVKLISQHIENFKENFKMSIETILIVVLIVFLLGGGGWYWGRGRA